MLRATAAFCLLAAHLAPSRGFSAPRRPRARPQRSAVQEPRSASAEPLLRHTVELDLAERSYPIHIGEGLLCPASELLAPHVASKVLVITNEKVGPLYLEACVAALRQPGSTVTTLTLADGEATKNMASVMSILDEALTLNLDRRSVFVALGGGVIGDMVGFAAAIYQRGVRFVQIPTSLMAMVDSSVGGKTGVNHPQGKNMIGAFMQPQCVLIDTQSLASLPDRELASGVAEIVKYGLINDPALFVWLEENVDRLLARDTEALAHVVKRSCEIKAEIVALDEREGGVRATLNLGHTFGHAIELGLGYGQWLHGEAVGLGMVIAAEVSLRHGWITEELRDRTLALIKKCKCPVVLPEGHGLTVDGFKAAMAKDKKVKDGSLFLILLEGELGQCVITNEYDQAIVDDVLAEFCA